jgi:hypothetical protein
VWIWLGTVVAFGVGLLAFDQWAYGKATSTGYSPGEITFSFSALWPNIKDMPRQLTTSMPFWLLAGAACVLIGLGVVRSRRSSALDEHARGLARRDAVVASVLAAGWLGL